MANNLKHPHGIERSPGWARAIAAGQPHVTVLPERHDLKSLTRWCADHLDGWHITWSVEDHAAIMQFSCASDKTAFDEIWSNV